LEPVNYFLAIWPLVDNEEKEELAKMNKNGIMDFNVALVYLLSFVMPKMPVEAIQAHYADIFAKVGPALERFIIVPPFVRATLVILGSVLSSFSSEMWKERSSLGELLSIVLKLTVEPRPKVRKLAQETLQPVFRRDISTARQMTISFMVQMVLEKASRKNFADALHAIAFLRLITNSFEQQEVELLIRPLLRCAAAGNTHLTVAAYAYLAMICELVAEGRLALSECLRESMREELFGKLRPDITVSEICPAWINASAKALGIVADSRVLRASLLVLLSFFASPEESVLKGILEALRGVYHLISDEALAAEVCTHLGRLMRNPPLPRTLPYIIQGLGDYCREVAVPSLPRALLLDLVACHESQKKHSVLIEKSISAFISQFGPKAVLEVVPLNLRGEPNPRAWLLPLLNDAVSHAELAFFITHLLPCAEHMDSRSATFTREQKSYDASVCQVISHQIWATLPAFMTFPTDFGDWEGVENE